MQLLRVLLQVRMDEDEIDSWYEEEKQKRMDEYLSEIEAEKNHEEAEKKYENKLGKVINRYNELMNETMQNKKTGKLKRFLFSVKSAIFPFKEK